MTPSARQFRAWLEAVNSGDVSQVAAFFTENCKSHPGSRAEREMGFWRSGGFDLRSTEQDSETVFRGLLQDRACGYFERVQVEVEADAPWQVTRFTVDTVPAPPGLAPRRLTEREALSALARRLDDAASRDAFSGAVLVARNGTAVYSQAYGLRDRDQGLPNTPDTHFNVASMGKMFTGVAVTQLVQDGKIETSAPLGRYVPDYPDSDTASQVTVHHLLTHTGGTGDIFGPGYAAIQDRLHTVRDYVTAFGSRGLAFKPGSSWEYSNYGYILLGRIIEQVSGQTYYDYVREHVFGPAGMHASGYQQREIPDHAIPYSRRSATAPWEPRADMRGHRGSPAGGCYSTVGDMGRFADALVGHRLLDPAHTELVTTGKVEARGGHYAYGFGDFTVDGVRWFGHGGGAGGVNGDLRIYPDSGYAVVVLANLDPPAAVSMSSFTGDRLPADAHAKTM